MTKTPKKPLTEEQKQRKREQRRKRYIENYEKEKENRKRYYEENKEWFAEYRKKYHADHKERMQAVNRANYWKNKEAVDARHRQHHHENKEKLNAKKKEKYYECREEILEKRRLIRLENIEVHRAYHNEYRKKNQEKVSRYAKSYNDKYPQRGRLLRAKRRAREKGNGGTLSKDIAQRLMELQKGKCRVCGKPLKGDYHIDHIVPLAKGGPNTDSNCQLLHSKCNLSKGAKDPYDYAMRLGRLFL